MNLYDFVNKCCCCFLSSGDWSFVSSMHVEEEEEKLLQNENSWDEIIIDEDADVDESGENDDIELVHQVHSINVKEYRRGNQRNWQHRAHNMKKNTTQFVLDTTMHNQTQTV